MASTQHRSFICLPYLLQPQARCLTGKSEPDFTMQPMPEQQPRHACVPAALQRATTIPENPFPGVHQEQQPVTESCPAHNGSYGGRQWQKDAQRPHVALGCTGQELPVPSMGWLRTTARGTLVHCYGPALLHGLAPVTLGPAACTEPACSCSVFINMTVWSQLCSGSEGAQRWDVSMGGACSQGGSYPCTRKEGKE